MNKLVIYFVTLIFASSMAFSQFLEDALRLSKSNGMVTPRVAGLNVAYHGVADDIGALIYNPAGLSLSGRSEISFGFGFIRNNSNTDYLDAINDFSSNSANISHIAISSPFKMGDRKAAIGIGYFEDNNYFNDMKFEAFNNNNTYIDYEARNGSIDPNMNFATSLGLADSRNFNTPIKDSVQQIGFVQESGGLRNITGGAGFDVSDYIAVGFAVSGKFGTYDYRFELEEIDRFNKYNFFDEQNFENVDMDRWYYEERLLQDISGISGSIGIQARIEDYMRFGATIKFPTYYEIEETWTRDANARYDNGDIAPGNGFSSLLTEGRTSYNVTTPFEYGAGFSVNAKGLTFTAGVEYSDATQIEFSDATVEVERLNRQILEQLTGQTTWGFGLEYNIPGMPLVARGSYGNKTSPYGDDVPGASLTFFSLGGGVYLGSNVRIDGVFRWTELSELRTVYGNQNYLFTQNPLNMGLQITYRY